MILFQVSVDYIMNYYGQLYGEYHCGTFNYVNVTPTVRYTTLKVLSYK